MAKTILTWLSVASLCLFSEGVGAQTQCRPHDDWVRTLATEFREKPVVIALTRPTGLILEFLASPDGRTWTILLTRPDGMACLVLSGTGYERITVPIGDPS